MDHTRSERNAAAQSRPARADSGASWRRDTDQPGMTWPPAMPFEDVLLRARASDHEALTLLYRRFLPAVYRFTLARVADTPTAEDITSETFFAVIERISETRAHDELTFAAWILGIARNQVANHYRRQRAHPAARLDEPSGASALEIPAPASDGDPLRALTARERWAEVVDALNQLTSDQRDVLLYRVILGYSAEDVAGLLGRKPGAVRALQFRALASLARLLGLEASPRGQGAPGDTRDLGWKGGR